jgi:hypothetical protein
MEERDFPNETTYGSTNNYGETNNTDTATSKVKDNITAVKERVTEQAADLKDKLSAQASTLGNQLTQKIDNARGKTSAGLRTTSQRIQNLAMYMEEHDAKDRKHPGKSLLVGLIAGLLVGRIFSMGGGHHHSGGRY